MKLGDEVEVDGVTYVLVDGGFIRNLTDPGVWVRDLCQLNSNSGGLCPEEFRKNCGSRPNIFVKKLEV